MNDTIRRCYNDIRARNKALRERRVAEVYARDASFASIDEQRGLIVKQLASGKIPLAQAQSRIASLSAQRQTRLIAMGYSAQYLDPIYTCPLCRDTGETGTELKKPCACQLALRQQFAAEGARINPRETFASFDLSIYPTDAQRTFGQKCKAFCERYVNELPHPQKPFLLFVGQAGLGKSYFANAIAAEAISRGVETQKATAYRFVQDALDGVRTYSEPLARYSRVPLLILDDLGIEPMIPNITCESLLRVLNERYAQQLPTIIVTNLDIETLSAQYGERICSRMLDGAITAIVRFTGKNLRIGRH